MREALIEVCNEFSVPYIDVRAGKHPYFLLDVAGQRHRIAYSRTPSDVHAPEQAARDLRRSIEGWTSPSPVVPKTETVAPSPTLFYEGAPIHDRGDKLCLTDMWRAGGSDPSRRPVEWLRSAEAKRFIGFMETIKVDESRLLVEVNHGRGGETFAQWQIGLAYAQYLSPKFHYWCNTVVRAYMEGGAARPTTVVAEDRAPAPSRELLVEDSKGLIRTVLGGVKRILSREVVAPLEAKMQDLDRAIHQRDRAAFEYQQITSGRIREIRDVIVGADPALLGLATGAMVDIAGVYDLAYVPPDQVPRRGVLSKAIGRSLDAYCRRNRHAVGHAEIRGIGVDTWAVNGVRSWLTAAGLDLIQTHIEKYKPVAEPAAMTFAPVAGAAAEIRP